MEKLVVKIEGDSSGLGKALQSAENRLNSLNTRISNTSRGLTNLQTRMGNFGQSLQAMAAANLRMANNLNTVSARLNSMSAAAARSSSNLRNTNKAAGSLSTTLWDVSRKIAMVNTLFFVGGGIFGGLIGSVISANSQMEKMGVLLKNISTAGTEAGKSMEAKGNMKYLWDMAENAPFDIEALTKTFVKLKASGIDPTQGSMQALVDTVAFFGGSTDEMNRAGIALSQMLSKGKVTAEELRQQLGDAVPNAMKDMAEALEMTIPELDKKMRKGLILSADAVPKLMKLWQEKYKGGAENMMTTWEGLMANMQTKWKRMVSSVTEGSGENSFFGVLKKNLQDLGKFLDSADGANFFKEVQSGLAKVTNAVVSAIKFIYEYRDTIISVGKAFVTYWAVGRIAAGVSSIIGIFGQLGKIIHIIGLNTSASTRFMLLFGASARDAAKAIGLLNAAGTLSLGWLAIVGGSISAVVGAVYLWNKANAESAERQAKMAKETADLKAKVEEEITSINSLNDATAQERQSSLWLIEAKRQEIKERQQNITKIMQEAQAKVVAAKADADRLRKELKPGGATGGVRDPMDRGVNGVTGFRVNRETAEARAATWNAIEQQGELDKLVYALDKKEEELKNWKPSEVAGNTSADSGDGDSEAKKKADKLAAELDRLKEKYIALIVTRKQLQHELANGSMEDFDDDEALKSATKEANLVQGGIKGFEDAIIGIKKPIRDFKQDIKDFNVLGDLTMEFGEAKDEIHFLSEAIANEYETLDSVFDRINTTINDRYTKALAKANEGNKAEIQKRIDMVKNAEKQIRVLELTRDYQEKNRDLEESLMEEDELRQSLYEREKARILDIIDQLNDKNDIDGKARNLLNQYLGNLEKVDRIKRNPFAQWAMDAKQLDRNVKNDLVGSMDNFIDATMEGKASFKDFATSILRDLSKIIIKALIARAIMAAFGGGLAGPMSIGGSTGSSDLSGSFISSDLLPTLGNHDGGVVGKEASFSRMVDSSVFSFAKRYHSGGFPGLRSDEVPTILQKGEGVFTAEQMRVMGSRMNSDSGAAPQVNIINQTSQPVSQETTSQKFDGEKWVVDIMLKHSNKPGPVRDMMKGMK